MADLRVVYPPEIWARESLMILQNTHVMANLVHRDFNNEIAQYGDTINTRKPDKFSVGSLSNTITASMTAAAATATPVQILLDKHQYVAFAITGRDQMTSIKNLIEEFMEPATIPLAQKIDDDLMNTTDGLGDITTAGISKVNVAATALSIADFAAVRKQLRSQQVPFTMTNRQSKIHIVLGVEHEAQALQISEIVTANQSGINPPAVLTGFINTIYGMNIWADQGVPAGSTTTLPRSLCFHRNAINLTTRPMEQVGGEFGIRSSVVSKDGISLRVMQSYQHLQARWVMSFDILYGYKILDPLLATVLEG